MLLISDVDHCRIYTGVYSSLRNYYINITSLFLSDIFYLCNTVNTLGTPTINYKSERQHVCTTSNGTICLLAYQAGRHGTADRGGQAVTSHKSMNNPLLCVITPCTTCSVCLHCLKCLVPTAFVVQTQHTAVLYVTMAVS